MLFTASTSKLRSAFLYTQQSSTPSCLVPRLWSRDLANNTHIDDHLQLSGHHGFLQIYQEHQFLQRHPSRLNPRFVLPHHLIPNPPLHEHPSSSIQLLTYAPESSLGHLLRPPNCLPPRPPQQTYLPRTRLGEIYALTRRCPSQWLYLRARQCVAGDWMGMAAYAGSQGG